jgi:cell division protein FtsB
LQLDNLWHDPVLSKIIAGVIFSIAATIAAYFKGWLPKLTKVLMGHRFRKVEEENSALQKHIADLENENEKLRAQLASSQPFTAEEVEEIKRNAYAAGVKK